MCLYILALLRLVSLARRILRHSITMSGSDVAFQEYFQLFLKNTTRLRCSVLVELPIKRDVSHTRHFKHTQGTYMPGKPYASVLLHRPKKIMNSVKHDTTSLKDCIFEVDTPAQ